MSLAVSPSAETTGEISSGLGRANSVTALCRVGNIPEVNRLISDFTTDALFEVILTRFVQSCKTSFDVSLLMQIAHYPTMTD
jgi:hypothetical protein